MATETTKGLDRRELFRRLVGRRVDLTTTCGTFAKGSGHIKEVFDDFIMFLTTRESAGVTETFRHWILMDAVTVVSEVPKVATEEVEITR